MLTDKQEKFCNEYLLDLNATQAAIRSGYSQDSAKSIASENLTKPDIQERIEFLRRDMANKFNISRERIAQELSRIAFSDLRGIFDKDGNLLHPTEWPDDVAATISSVETDAIYEWIDGQKSQIGVTKKVKVWEKVKAIEALNKLMGYNSPDKTELTTPPKFEITLKI